MTAIKIFIILLLFISLAIYLIHGINSINQDIGRHLKSGQIIWETGNIYKTNTFSYTRPGNEFVNHHWLSELIFYHLNNYVGLKGLIVIKTIIIISAFLLLFSFVAKNAGFWPWIFSFIPGIIIFTYRTDVRPEIFSYLYLSIFLFCILKSKYERRDYYLWLLPIIQILWVNSHIYFALGPILLFFYLIDRFFADKKNFVKYLIIFCATSLSTLINPNFIVGALTPFTILRDYGYSIVENQNVFFLKDYRIAIRDINIFYATVILWAISFYFPLRKKVNSLFEILTAIAFSGLAFKMIRNFGPYGMTFIPLVALNLRHFPRLKWLTKRVGILSVAIIFLLISALLIKNTLNNNIQNWLSRSAQFGLIIPDGAGKGVDFVKTNNLKGPIFNNFDVGSFLIWGLYPEEKVFVDGRPEAYDRDFFNNIYKPMQEDDEKWKYYSDLYQINYVFWDYHDITPWSQTFLARIINDKNWPPIYLDGSVVIFIKRTPENQSIIDRLEIIPK